MVASVRGAHFRGVTIGQTAIPPNPNIFLDNFNGSIVVLSSHTPDIGNAWTYWDGETTSTTGTGSAASDNSSQASSYRTALNYTGTDIEVSFFIDANPSTSQSGVVTLRKPGPGFPVPDPLTVTIQASTNFEGESGVTVSRYFQILVDGDQKYFYSSSNFSAGVEYKMTISGTTVTSYVAGAVVDTGTITALTEGPTELFFDFGKSASISNVSLTINNATPI